MADISLRTYIEEVDSLIERKLVDEAIAHCRHILTYYPKHLETYRLLGKALLEVNRHGDAADIFQRVLSAVPDDFIAHVGMSIIREDEANLDAALWHMERAFEVNPANAAIQEELRRLYGRRDGVNPPKARLTRGALARMYALGELYLQAEAELNTALQEDPERVDLSTILAHVYWQGGRQAEAAQTCTGILQKLPYSQEANRILATILQDQGRQSEAKPYKKRLEALDPYEAFTNGKGPAEVNSEAVRLPKLDYTPDMTESGAPGWVASIGMPFQERAEERSDDETPSWLTDALTPSPAESAPMAVDAASAAELPEWLRELQPADFAGARQTPSEAELPPGESAEADWLKEFGAVSEEAGAAEPAAEIPDWLKAATGPLASEPLPDWQTPEPESPSGFDRAAEPELPSARKPEPPSFGEPEASAAALPGEDLPDWLKDIAPEAPSMPQAAPEEPAPFGEMAAEPAAEMPDWLKGLARPEPSPPKAAGEETVVSGQAEEMPAAMPSDEMPDWLKGMAPAAPAAPQAASEEALSQPESDEDLPEWMRAPSSDLTLPAWMRPEAPAAEEAEATRLSHPAETAPDAGAPEASADEDLPEWLRGTPPAPGDMPDWLQALGQPPQAEMPGPMAPAGRQPDAGEEAAQEPAVFESTGPEAAALKPADEDELPDWMKDLAPDAGAVPEWMKELGAPPQAEAPAQPEVELPDFLQPASPEAIARANQPTPMEEFEAPAEEDIPAAEPAELPDWMKDLAPDQPAAEAPASPEAAAPQDLSAMDADEAMRWLEGLALQQGARPEEMVSGPPAAETESPAPTEEEVVEPPEWLRAPEEKEHPPAAPARPAEPPALSAADSFTRWLADKKSDKPPAAAQPPAQTPAAPDTESVTPPKAQAEEEQRPAAEQPPDQRPAWEETHPLSASDSFTRWLADKDVPDWIRKPGAEPAAPPPDWLRTPAEAEPPAPAEPEEAAAPPAMESQPAAGEPTAPPEAAAEQDFEQMSPDEALRWLESLAAQQGARPEELITRPEDRLAGPEAPAAEEPPPTGMAEAAEPAASAEAESEPDVASMSADEAIRWLESLAAQQGAPPEELITRPEERAAQPPDWAQAETPAAAEATPEPEAPAETPAPEAAAQPDFESMSPDDTLRWLEGLAAQQGARPEELITRPEERAEQPPEWPGHEEMPAHDEAPEAAQAEMQGVRPEESVTPEPETMDLPGQAESPAEQPPLAEAAAPPAGMDFESMSPDEALRWLESLAAQQGARPEELISQPEERTAEPPQWISAQPPEGLSPPAEEQAPAAEPEPAQPEAGTIELHADAGADALAAEALAAEAPTAEAPTAPETTAPEVSSWLESLAAEPADEAAPTAAPAPPDWVRIAPDTHPAEAPAQQPPPEKAAPAESAQARPAEQPEVPTTGTGRLGRLAEKLAAVRRAKESEIEARFASQRAEQEAARQAVQEKMEQKRRPGTGPLQRAAGKTQTIGQAQPPAQAAAEAPQAAAPTESAAATVPQAAALAETAAATVPQAAAPAETAAATVPQAAAPKPTAQLPRPEPAAKSSKKTRKGRSKSPYASEPVESVIETGKTSLSEGDYETAEEALGYLVSSGQMVDEVVAALERVSFQRPSTAPLLRVLGDAYMRQNQLQKALDAYRQALGQM